MSSTVWLVVLVTLAIFGWLVSQAMPTPRDRQLQRLRTRARERDLHVSVRQLKDPDPEPARRVASSGVERDARLDVAGYALPLRLPAGVETRHAPSWRVARMRNHPDERYEDGLPAGWRLDRAELPLRAPVLEALSGLLGRLPEGAAVLEASPREVTVFWRERGEVDAVDALAALLGDVAAFQRGLAEDAANRERRERGREQPGDDADDG